MRNILVTGSSGLVSGFIISELAKAAENVIWAASSRLDMCKIRFESFHNVHAISNDKLLSGGFDFDIVDAVIHCAFTRSNDQVTVASSLLFTQKILLLASRHHVKEFLYTSTRSVYMEPAEGRLNTENSEISPAGSIGIAKYAVELMLTLVFTGSGTHYCSLRLSSVNELKTERVLSRPINTFVKRVIAGQPLQIRGGMQIMSYIAPHDIATAVSALLDTPSSNWKHVYNIGSGWKCTDSLINIAHKVVKIGCEQFGLAPVNVEVEDVTVNQRAGLDITLINTDTGWEPKQSMEDLIADVFRLELSNARNLD